MAHPLAGWLCLLLLALPGFASQGPALHLLHVNDVHGALPARRDGAGGLARLGGEVRRIRVRAMAEGAPLLFVHAGDLFQGTPLVNATRGACMAEAMAAAGVHFGVPGNHEWDYGPEALAGLAAAPRPLLVSSSIRGMPQGTRTSLVFDLEGIRIGFVGFTLPKTPEKAPPGATRGLEFLAGPEALASTVAGLRRRGVEAVVLVSHADRDQDESLARALDLDLVIGGHEAGDVPPTPIAGSRAWYTRTRGSLLSFGHLRLGFDRESGRLAGVEGGLVDLEAPGGPVDPALDAMVARLRAAAGAEAEGPEVHLEARLGKGIWSHDSPLVKAMAHALREASGADLALLNPSACRVRSLGPGLVDAEALYQAFPYENSIAVVEIEAGELDRLYEDLASAPFRDFDPARLEAFRAEGLAISRGRFLADERGLPQPSGFVVEVDPDRPPGSRIRLLAADGNPLTGTFRLATSDYLAAGGDGYTRLSRLPRRLAGGQVREAVGRRLVALGSLADQGPGGLRNLSVEP